MTTCGYISRQLRLRVVFAAQPGVIETLEGPVSFQPGDAIVTGLAGEQWPVHRARFESRYVPADGQGAMGRDGWYVKKPVQVQACRAESDLQVPLTEERGLLRARRGDWVLTDADGSRWVVADGIFQQVYEPEAQE